MNAGVINTSPGEPESRLAGDFETHPAPTFSIQVQYQNPAYAMLISESFGCQIVHNVTGTKVTI